MRGELLEDNSSSADRSMSGKAASLPLPGWEEGKGGGSSSESSARPASSCARRRSFSSRNRFVCSAICLACSSCLTSIS